MTRFLLPVATLVAGILLGTWQPRGELLTLREEMDTLRAEVKKPCRQRGATAIREILRAPEAAPPPVPRVVEAPAGQTAPPPPPTMDADSVAALKAGLDARRAQALEALTEQADLSDVQADDVDQVMEEMNQRLKAEVDQMVEEVLAAGEVDRRDMLEFGAAALDIVLDADDRMREIIPPDLAVDDSAVDPFSYISGETVASLQRLEGLPGFQE